jgi:hypothetical protein
MLVDCRLLKELFDELRLDEIALLRILCNRSAAQRLEIRDNFKTKFNQVENKDRTAPRFTSLADVEQCHRSETERLSQRTSQDTSPFAHRTRLLRPSTIVQQRTDQRTIAVGNRSLTFEPTVTLTQGCI